MSALTLSTLTQSKVVPVEVPELTGTLYVRELTVGQLLAVGQEQQHNNLEFVQNLFFAVICDEQGHPMFSSLEQAGQIPPSILKILEPYVMKALGLLTEVATQITEDTVNSLASDPAMAQAVVNELGNGE